MNIRRATAADFVELWRIIEPIVRKGDTYGFDPQLTAAEAKTLWLETSESCWLAEQDGRVLGTYYLKANMKGPGSHVCNCGYMVAPEARGQGIATGLCEHSKETAVQAGFKAMQFNLVAASNVSAVRLWQKLGFAIIGTLPKAFNHPQAGYVDAYVMYQWLTTD